MRAKAKKASRKPVRRSSRRWARKNKSKGLDCFCCTLRGGWLLNAIVGCLAIFYLIVAYNYIKAGREETATADTTADSAAPIIREPVIAVKRLSDAAPPAALRNHKLQKTLARLEKDKKILEASKLAAIALPKITLAPTLAATPLPTSPSTPSPTPVKEQKQANIPPEAAISPEADAKTSPTKCGGYAAPGAPATGQGTDTNDCLFNAAVVVLAHNRPQILERTLSALFEQSKDDLARFSVYVSLDSPHSGVQSVVQKYTQSGRVKALWQYPDAHQAGGCRSMPDRILQPQGNGQQQQRSTGYFKITVHVGCALQHAFETLGHTHLVVIEDDLMPAKDFLAFFRQTAWLLHRDPSLWCVSSW